MNPLELQQGSPEWLTAREGQLTASLAPAMMGVGYQSRDKAMRSFLGLSQPEELTPFVKNMFEQGHIAEANARPVAEQLIGESLSPITGTREHCDIMFFASFDGLTFDNGLVWEHKKTDKVFDEIPPLFYWQMEHQMIVANTESSLLTITDDAGKIRHIYYKSLPERRSDLVKGWQQWIDDCSVRNRTDPESLDLEEEYINLLHEINVRETKLKLVRQRVEKHSKDRNMTIGRLSLTWHQKSNKQTPSAYIKERDIELPDLNLEPTFSSRITINKEE